ncbi:hypothetical protein Clacol_008291 [Clathrus columnatus]|uniref:Terpene synthase n=1 Tax=Clathrus columnatus TaxID=1419009 RepID=A0AAV5AMT8_9AGAM|nr:hypothetical protein Clacol_008291 [Clathrus columnatus]
MSFSTSNQPGFFIPDLWAHCPYPVLYQKNGDEVGATSEKWVQDSCRVITPLLRQTITRLGAPQLAAYCYNQCSDERFRLVCDFMITLFLLDDLSDDLATQDSEIFSDIVMNALHFPESYRPTQSKGKEQPILELDCSKLTRDYWLRMSTGTTPAVQARIVEDVEQYLIAVHLQAQYRDSGDIPSLEEYIEHRRMSSGCKPLFHIIEYSLNIEIPEEVLTHPLMVTMKNCVNDFVAFSNDIFSYNVEQARGDEHNMITVMMKKYNLDLQSAVNRVGDLCIDAIKTYQKARADFPSFGPTVDRDLESFFHGLQSWMSGSIEWSFVTPRYLGPNRHEIREHKWVTLMKPKTYQTSIIRPNAA